MLARVAAKASSNGDIACTDEIVQSYAGCASQCDESTCLTHGDMCDSAKCGTCMACQFTLFNSLPAATAYYTEDDMAVLVNAQCAVDTPMTEQMCDSIGPALLFNNPRMHCLITFKEVHEPQFFAEFMACYAMDDPAKKACNERVNAAFIDEIMNCYVQEGFEIKPYFG